MHVEIQGVVFDFVRLYFWCFLFGIGFFVSEKSRLRWFSLKRRGRFWYNQWQLISFRNSSRLRFFHLLYGGFHLLLCLFRLLYWGFHLLYCFFSIYFVLCFFIYCIVFFQYNSVFFHLLYYFFIYWIGFLIYCIGCLIYCSGLFF